MGTGPLSDIAIVHQRFSIDRVACSPAQFYAGDKVECSAIIGGEIITEYDYAWETEDGTLAWTERVDGGGGSTAAVTWDSAGGKPLRVVACRSGDASDYTHRTIPIVGLIGTTAAVESEGACSELTQTINVADLAPSISIGIPRSIEPIRVGDSFDLHFSVGRKSWVGGQGGITISFPGLTLKGADDDSSYYNSSQARVQTVGAATTISNVVYYDSASEETLENAGGGQVQPQHLTVSASTSDWPALPSIPVRTVRLRITPKEAGEFSLQYRYWLCNEERTDSEGRPHCNRHPKQDDPDNGGRDGQGWGVYELTVTVVEKPAIESVGCAAGPVDVGVAVDCAPVLSGGSVDEYSWRAGYGVVGGNPSSGSDPTFSTEWDFSGQQTVSLTVCNVVSDCASAEQTITVNPDPEAPEPEPVTPPTIEEEEPDDGGRVLIAGPASDWAHSDYTPTDGAIQVRALPTSPLPTLEITIYDEDGFAGGTGQYVSPGAIILALPEDVWVEYGQIGAEMHIAGSWVDYTDELEQSLLALESASGEARRTAATVLGLSPAASGAALTASDRLAWGLGETGHITVDDIFQARYANCVSHVSMAWLAWAADTKGVRISVPVDLSADDYVSLATAFIAAEPDAAGGKEPALAQAHDLLDTGDDTPGCAAP